jgi:hypothetical protein
MSKITTGTMTTTTMAKRIKITINYLLQTGPHDP